MAEKLQNIILRYDAQSSVQVPAEPNHGLHVAYAAVRWFPNGLNV
jgi:hypothetical protein